MRPRQPELVGKIFKDADDNPLEGTYILAIADDKQPTRHVTTTYSHKNGKVHGNPAVQYPDGQEEIWEDGSFIEVSKLAFSKRVFEDLP